MELCKFNEKTEEERHEIMDRYINNDDRKRNEEFMSRLGANVDSPEVVALWYAGFNGRGNFDLISTNEQSSELIKTLYAEMQKEMLQFQVIIVYV